MTVDTKLSSEVQSQDQKVSDKEFNFRRQEQMYQKMLAEKEARIAEIERQLSTRAISRNDDEDDDSDPYVDKRKLEKKLSSFEEKLEAKIEKKAEEKARKLLEEEKRNQWLSANPDFYDVMSHVEKFAQKAPELAKAILEMPDTFERQKLVYNNIKTMGVHKPEESKPSIQQTIEQNRRSPYYQPSNVGTAPYASHGDFSASGQKNAYEKMLELKNRLRLG